MLRQLSRKIQDQQFFPTAIGIFVNPFYFVRRELWRAMGEFSADITGKTLDVGCGYKPYQSLFTHTDAYVGLEYDSPANRKIEQVDVFFDGTHFPFKNAEFDSIILTQVLEHIFEPDSFLSEINRVTKTGGRLLMSVPFVWDEHSQPVDYARYSSFGIRHLLEKHGFRMIKHKKTLTDVRVFFQLINCYIHNKIRIRNYRLRILVYSITVAPVTLLGIISAAILPKNLDLYMDNVILAEKI